MPSSFDCPEARTLLLLLCLLVKIEGKYPLSSSAYAFSSVIFSPSLLSRRPILPFAALLLFVYLTLFLTPSPTFANQYLILCLCLFWFCPFMSSDSHLLTPVFLLIHFMWCPFHSHAFWKLLVQVQYIDLLLFHIFFLGELSGVAHWVVHRNFLKALPGFLYIFFECYFFPPFQHSCKGSGKCNH